MTLKTRQPTGRPGWPILLIAGVEKAGKSYAAAAASASDLIGQTYWIGFGEQDPDEYGQIGRFEIVEHEGTYRDLLRAIDDVNAVPAGEKPTLLVIDSMTPVWDLLKDEVQEAAWRAASAKAARQRQPFDKAADEVKPSMDLWNLAAQRWGHIMSATKAHQGPVILTARLDEVSEVERNAPTGRKEWTIKAHKSLPYDVSAIVEMRAYRDALIRGVRSLRWQAAPDELVPVRDFTVAGLWERIGLADSTAAVHRGVSAEASLDADQTPDPLTAVKQAIAALCPEGAQVRTWAPKQFADRGLDMTNLEDARAVLSALEGHSDGPPA